MPNLMTIFALDIGEEKKSIEFEPIPETAPVEEPAPVVVPEKEEQPV